MICNEKQQKITLSDTIGHAASSLCRICGLLLVLSLSVLVFAACSDENGEGELLINEVMTKNTTFLVDCTGNTSDWIELYNAGDSSLNLGNWFLTDNDRQLKKYAFPSIIMKPGEYRVVFCDGENYYDALHDEIHSSFSLSSKGEKIWLISRSGRTQSVEIGRCSMNISYGRLEDGSFAWFAQATPGGKNTGKFSSDISEVAPEYPADLVISEFCASNDLTEPNADGKCCGFVSVRNISDNEIRLSDYCLSDSDSNISKWRFPTGATLKPGMSRRVICSGLDKVDGSGILHSSFKLNGKDSVILLSAGGEVLQRFSLGKRYEGICSITDGASAYVKYTRLLDSTKKIYDTPEQAASISNCRVILNEVSAIKGNGAKNDYDWVELYNPTSEDISLNGWKLSDNDEDSEPFVFGDVTIGAGEYKLVYCSKNKDAITKSGYAHFSLSSSGEKLALYDSSGRVEDTLVYFKLRNGVTAGKARNGTTETVYFSSPTPGNPNSERNYSGYVEMPSFNIDGGFVDSGTLIKIKSCPEGAVCRYTTDGTVPNEESPVFEGFTVEKNTVLRVCAFEKDKIKSDTVTSTFLTDDKTEHTIPVVCLTSEPDGLFSSARGIMAFGGNAKKAFPYYGANFWQDWERDANFEYYVDGVKALDVSAGIKIFGQFSRANQQKSLSVFFRNDYGASSVCFPFFEDCDRQIFTSLVLRAGGQDQFFTRIRDAFTSQVMKGYTSLVFQEWQPVALYINGRYWGLYDLREKINAEWLGMYAGVDENNLDLIKGDSYALDGDLSAYRSLVNYANTHNLENDEYYQYVTERIDVDNFIDYLITEIFFVNGDTGNIKLYCDRGESGKWRWIMFDFDMAMRNNALSYNKNMFEEEFSPLGHGNGLMFSTELRCALLKNANFRKRFRERFDELLNTAFTSEHMRAVLERMSDRIKSEIPLHCERWAEPTSYAAWEKEINNLYRIIDGRPKVCKKQLDSFDRLK